MTSPRREYTEADVQRMAAMYRTWGQWGPDDEKGSTNYVTPETVKAATQLVKRGAVFSLSIPFDRNGPTRGRSGSSRINPQHVMFKHGGDLLAEWETAQHGMQSTDDGIYMALQSATQWDAFCHVFFDGKTYNGWGPESVTSSGAKHNSITEVRTSTVGRGVLLDFPRFYDVPWLEPGDAIQDNDLEACAKSQGVDIGAGDFVLIRTGHMTRRRNEEFWGDFTAGSAPGLGLSGCDYLLPRHISGVASDTWGLEVLPTEAAPHVRHPVHVILLVSAGVLIGEIWDMDELAADCATDGVYEFFLSAPPLAVTGAVGSPLNPIAIK